MAVSGEPIRSRASHDTQHHFLVADVSKRSFSDYSKASLRFDSGLRDDVL